MTNYWKYFKYVIRHKWYVFKFCCKLGMYWRGIVHDISKFQPCEFISYARYFCGNTTEDDAIRNKRKIDFNKAWDHHKKHNKHHWEHWLITTDNGEIKPKRMPIKYLKEMVCDLHAMTCTISDSKIETTIKWFMDHKEINLNFCNKVEIIRIFDELDKKINKTTSVDLVV